MSRSLNTNESTNSEDLHLRNLQARPTTVATPARSSTRQSPPAQTPREPSLRPRSSLDHPVRRGSPTSSNFLSASANDSRSALLSCSTSLRSPDIEAAIPHGIDHASVPQAQVDLQEIDRTARQEAHVADSPIHAEIDDQSQVSSSRAQSQDAEHSSLDNHRPGQEEPVIPHSQTSSGQQEASVVLKQWKSWKTDRPYLLLLLTITVLVIIVLGILDWVSRSESGFSQLGTPPSFLAKKPALEKALWTQGILYTSLPAFFMTLYNMLFSSTVTKFMELQPYVDLANPNGAPAKTTIILDYRTYPVLYGFIAAFRNGHRVLAVYMGLSLCLTIAVVPLTAFLFTDGSFNFNATIPVSFTTVFNQTIVQDSPDFKLPMDFAAAFRIFGGSPPPWTDGQYSFPRAMSQSSIEGKGDETNLTIEATAYSAYIDCREIPEEEYSINLLDPIDDYIPAPIYQISSNDRGCMVSSNFRLQHKDPLLGEDINNRIIKPWATQGCLPEAGYSRLSIASGYYVQSTKALTNFSLISCIPSYWTTPGSLTFSASGLPLSPTIYSFLTHENQAKISPARDLSLYFEMFLQDLSSFNPTTNIDANDFGRHVFVLASKSYPESQFSPQAISEAAQMLFTSMYAVFVSTTILQSVSDVINITAIRTTKENRLVVVSPVAYVIIGILVCIAIAILTMFWYGQKPHILLEEPTGILSYVAIAHGGDLSGFVGGIVSRRSYDGKLAKQLKNERLLENTIWKRAAVGAENSIGSPIIIDRNPPMRQVVPTASPFSRLRGLWQWLREVGQGFHRRLVFNRIPTHRGQP